MKKIFIFTDCEPVSIDGFAQSGATARTGIQQNRWFPPQFHRSRPGRLAENGHRKRFRGGHDRKRRNVHRRQPETLPLRGLAVYYGQRPSSAEQQNAFERYIQAGGGYLGIHAASDTEYDWPWYGKLMGGWFDNHPSKPSNVQQGDFHVVDTKNPLTSFLPEKWVRKDEFYA